MKEDFKTYLKIVGITETKYLEKIEDIIEFFTDFGGEVIDDIFVSEYVKEDGSREYESISMFTKNWDFEAVQFLTEDRYAINKRKKPFWMEIKKKDYDFKKSTDKSRLSIVLKIEGHMTCNFKASKDNCDILRKLIFKYYIDNHIISKNDYKEWMCQ